MGPGAADPLASYVPDGTGWGNGIDAEPNTEYDFASDLMWRGADQDRNGHRAYLDAFLIPVGTGDASTRTTGAVGPMYRVFAYFGLWKDCDLDQTIGTAAGHALTYSSMQLPSNAPCQDGDIHNRNSIVNELIWVTHDGRSDLDNEYWGYAEVWAKIRNVGDDYDTHAAFPTDDPGIPGGLIPARRIELSYHRPILNDVSEIDDNGGEAIADVVGTSSTSLLGAADTARGPAGAACIGDAACQGWWSEPFVLAHPQAAVGEGALGPSYSPCGCDWAIEAGPSQAMWIGTYGSWPTAGFDGIQNACGRDPCAYELDSDEAYNEGRWLGHFDLDKAAVAAETPPDEADPIVDLLPHDLVGTGGLEANDPPAGYTACALQGGSCHVEPGQGIAYGAKNTYQLRTDLRGEIACGELVAGMGDPSGDRACYRGPVPGVLDPETLVSCANQGGMCAVATQDIAYGNEGGYIVKTRLTGVIACGDEFFGDPHPGYAKWCAVSAPFAG